MAQPAPALRADDVPMPDWGFREAVTASLPLARPCSSAAPPRPRGVRAGTTGVGLALAVASVAATAPAHAEPRDYTVRSGDTVSHIALRTGASVSSIVEANNLGPTALIRTGQRLTIPSPNGTSTTARSAAPAPASATRTHTVVAGDTVWALAQRYGTTVSAIVDANSLNSRAVIRIGQRLTIPGSTTPTTSAPAKGTAAASTPTSSAQAAPGRTHTVVAGDTVSALALRYGTTVKAIVEANSLNSRALIRIGQKLTIPGGGTAAASSGAQLVGNTFAGRTYPGTTVAAANANKSTLLAMQVPSRAEMQAKVAATATAMGVDPALAQAIAYQESGFNHQAVSPANAIGTMQVIPSSGEWASQLVGRELNLLDPDDNVVAGVAILRQLIRTAPDLPTAIAGYYQGLAGVKKYGMYPDTRRYVANVQTLMTRFR